MALAVIAWLVSGLSLTLPSANITFAQTADPVLVGAGDIASCGSTGDEATAALLDGIPGIVFTLGDNAYPSGTDADFNDCYHPTWGRHKARTYPSVGNHEYKTSGASGYFNYFGAVAGDADKGYYSYDLGIWHIIVLNTSDDCIAVGGCGVGSPQERWLRADLAANSSKNLLAYWHLPRFSSGSYGDSKLVQPFWEALYEYGAELVVNGHDHNYQRYAPQNPVGLADPVYGIRQFIVGTGGIDHYNLSRNPPNLEVANDATEGVLKLTLHPRSYSWEFIPVAGQSFSDSGSAFTHGSPPPTIKTTLIFIAEADTYADEAYPQKNHGSGTTLFVDTSGEVINKAYNSYLRFSVTGVTGVIKRAKLRLYAHNGTGKGPAVYTTSGDWSEVGLTWNNRPSLAASPGESGQVISSNAWSEFDVTSLISGNGLYSFALIPLSEDGLGLYARESNFQPKLMVTFETRSNPSIK